MPTTHAGAPRETGPRRASVDYRGVPLSRNQKGRLRATGWQPAPKTKMTFRRFAKGWLTGCAVLIILALGTSAGKHDIPPASTVLLYAGMIGIFLLALPVACYWAKRAVDDAFDAVTTPVPAPAQIAAQLEAEWGRPPTVTEVAAFHQMLTSQKNEALIASGITLGSLYMMNQQLKRH